MTTQKNASIATSWSIGGSEGLPIHGDTDHPAGTPRAVALVVHGFTGNKNRNIIPAVSRHLASAGLLSHRATLSHAGVGSDGDSIEHVEIFERDSLAFCLEDIRVLVEAIADGTIEGKGLPLVLVGHSRGGAQVLGAAGLSRLDGWTIVPSAVVSLAGTSTFTRLTDDVKEQLDRKGFVERVVARAAGGKVRMGPSWYAHHFREDGADLFGRYLAAIEGPVLIAHGEEDVSVPPSHAVEIEAILASNERCRVERMMIPGADHNFNALGVGAGHERSDCPEARALYGCIDGFLDRTI